MRPEDVPAGPLAVDSDVFSYLHLKESRHIEFGALVAGHPLALPFPVVGELRVLGLRSGWNEPRRARLAADIAKHVVLPVDDRVVERWATMRAQLMSQLKGDGINDLWIAACCLVYRLPIVTNNLSDFEKIASVEPKLKIVHPDL